MAAYQIYTKVQGGTWFMSIKGIGSDGKKYGFFREFTYKPTEKDKEKLVIEFEKYILK